MKDTDKLHRSVTKGIQARDELAQYEGVFAVLKDRYDNELIMSARAGKPTDPVANKLLALNDAVTELKSAIQTGNSAQIKLDTIALQAAQQVENEQAR